MVSFSFSKAKEEVTHLILNISSGNVLIIKAYKLCYSKNQDMCTFALFE